MKRTALEKHLRDHGCRLERHGGRHDIWINELTGGDATIPRHAEIKKHLARKICDQLRVPRKAGD